MCVCGGGGAHFMLTKASQVCQGDIFAINFESRRSLDHEVVNDEACGKSMAIDRGPHQYIMLSG